MAEMPLSMTMTLYCQINEHLGCSYFVLLAHLVHAHQRDMGSDYTSVACAQDNINCKIAVRYSLEACISPKGFQTDSQTVAPV